MSMLIVSYLWKSRLMNDWVTSLNESRHNGWRLGCNWSNFKVLLYLCVHGYLCSCTVGCHGRKKLDYLFKKCFLVSEFMVKIFYWHEIIHNALLLINFDMYASLIHLSIYRYFNSYLIVKWTFLLPPTVNSLSDKFYWNWLSVPGIKFECIFFN